MGKRGDRNRGGQKWGEWRRKRGRQERGERWGRERKERKREGEWRGEDDGDEGEGRGERLGDRRWVCITREA